MSLSHLMTPVVTLNGTVSTQYTTGFDQNAGLSGRESWISLQANWQAAPRSTVFFGARYQQQSDTSAALAFTESNETTVFVGLFHRL